MFRGLYLCRSNFTRAILKDVDFEGCNLQEAFFNKADMRGTNLKSARLKWALLCGANLENAILDGAEGLVKSMGVCHGNNYWKRLERDMTSRGYQDTNSILASISFPLMKCIIQMKECYVRILCFILQAEAGVRKVIVTAALDAFTGREFDDVLFHNHRECVYGQVKRDLTCLTGCFFLKQLTACL